MPFIALFLAFLVAFGGISFSELSSPGEIIQDFVIGNYTRHQEPDFLTFEELKKLSADPVPKGALAEKLKKFWTTPIVSNEAYYRGAKPHRPKDLRMGHYLRAVSWNIEKSFNIDEAIQVFTSEEAYKKMINTEEAPPDSDTYREMLRQRKRLENADVLFFQEMEIGMKRSDYKNAAAEMAAALNMNYAFATQYLEIDPVTMGLEELEFEEDDRPVEKEARDFFTVDPVKYKGVFGSAVLSRYPIKRVEVRPLENQPYDWYHDEIVETGETEGLRRAGAKILFKSAIQRELKVGGRHFFRVDLEVPGLPQNTLTVINIHLEIKCLPMGRLMQMEEILSYIEGIRNPVLIMGDFNMAPADISPTTAGRILKRTASSPTTWFSVAVNTLSPHALVLNTTRALSNFTKNLNDPTAKHIPVVAPNPCRPFFNMMESFRFKDGGAFDFRGDENRSTGHKDGKLANANQRGTRGFITSFRVLRPIGIVGKYRLDWVFVKSYLKDVYSGPYRFAPHFGETLEDMNFNLTLPVSDHAPNVVDLPFEEPKI